MPSGRTHDKITLWCLPPIAGFTFLATNSLPLTVVTALSFLVGGFMLGPDLDIRSIQYKRWGPLRWIWLPYQKTLKHRSQLSHGPIIGTALRVVYLSVWIALFTCAIAEILNAAWDTQLTWQNLSATFRGWGDRYLAEWLAALIGLELGAISHSASDITVSYFGRKRRQHQQKKRKKAKKPPRRF